MINLIQEEYNKFLELIQQFSPESIDSPGVVGFWSTKDILAHITTHQRWTIKWLEKIGEDADPGLPQPYDNNEDDLAVINSQIFKENRTRDFHKILSDLDQCHQDMLAIIRTMTGAELNDQRILRNAEPVWQAIAANTYGHYREHGQEIRDFFKE